MDILRAQKHLRERTPGEMNETDTKNLYLLSYFLSVRLMYDVAWRCDMSYLRRNNRRDRPQ